MDSLVGMTFSQWHKLLQQNNYATAPRLWLKNAVVTAQSIFNTRVAKLEKKEWGAQIERPKSNGRRFLFWVIGAAARPCCKIIWRWIRNLPHPAWQMSFTPIVWCVSIPDLMSNT